ncbi:hypothetical protein [Alkalibacterium olivapovliticus]|uniref:Uncharacterized protein n=1 Tax=Alkalibacterium olivapovliticus TaxID=99907 RepID=A0A2T0VWF9_9LACT|nr:hypothetical protein [Alkalibacterium olivapovliticus]PRY76191.1 hypothetical protein CLV38_13222 [Alkalibacterium olivapovliticus]
MKKKVLTVLSVLGLLFLLKSTSIQADDTPDLEAELNNLIEHGFFSPDVTLEQYKLAKEEEAEGWAWMEEESRRFEEEQRNKSK